MLSARFKSHCFDWWHVEKLKEPSFQRHDRLTKNNKLIRWHFTVFCDDSKLDVDSEFLCSVSHVASTGSHIFTRSVLNACWWDLFYLMSGIKWLGIGGLTQIGGVSTQLWLRNEPVMLFILSSIAECESSVHPNMVWPKSLTKSTAALYMDRLRKKIFAKVYVMVKWRNSVCISLFFVVG